MKKIYLKNLLSIFKNIKIKNTIIKNIKTDSKLIKNKDLFISTKCFENNKKNIINSLDNGASAALVSTDIKSKNNKVIFYKRKQIIFVYKLNKYLSKIFSIFYKNPSKYMKVIGVTGTNGKTTVSNIILQWINLLGKKSATIGTIGNGIFNKIKQTDYTTDLPSTVQRTLNDFRKNKVKYVSMEVSSHGLSQYRVDGVNFYISIFTNLSQDHLDYYKNMKEYEKSKWRLFSKLKVKKYVINFDDYVGKKWLYKKKNAVAVSSKCKTLYKFYKYWLFAKNISFHKNFTKINFSSIWGDGSISTKFIASFNINNILLSLTTLLLLGFSKNDLIKCSKYLNPVCGRMEKFFRKKFPKVIVDYSHNPESLKQSLMYVKKNCEGKIWCIFGCGGNRDKLKRPIMGNIASFYSDNLILTNDNPRFESEINIIKDILKGVDISKNIYIIYDRNEAIKFSLLNANLNDFVIICGKGHEVYQIIKNKKIYQSDRELVKKIINIK
ncbi:MAG: UDP-N-acetylmuramoyl-L-alanyl-D-glutamate--2,6-diaminopimelate ligase [Enterobacteriaceae bacterium]